MVWSPPMATRCDPALQQRIGARLDLGHRRLDVEGGAGDVAGVDDLDGVERRDVQIGMVGAEKPGALPDGARSEPGPGPVARPGIERDADHTDVPGLDLLHIGSRKKVADPGEPRYLGGVDRADRFVAVLSRPAQPTVGRILVGVY